MAFRLPFAPTPLPPTPSPFPFLLTLKNSFAAIFRKKEGEQGKKEEMKKRKLNRTGKEEEEKGQQNKKKKWKEIWEKIKEKAKSFLLFIANPRLLLCFSLGWMVTNGWAYVLLGLGSYFGITWMTAVAGAYLAILWLPISPEKIVTIAITITLLRFLFPKDEKTLGKMKEMKEKTTESVREMMKKMKEKIKKK